MSIKNFIPEIWAARMLGFLAKAHVLGGVANRDYEGDIKGYGDTVRITTIGDVTVSDYTRSTTITPAELTDAQTKLLISQAKYFAFKIDDLDKAQQTPKVMDGAISKSTYKLRDTADSFLAGLYTDAGSKLSNTDVNSANVIDYILSIAQKLDEKNVPREGRWLTLPPAIIVKLVKAKVLNETANSQVFDNGLVARALGFAIHNSNNLKTVSTYTQALAGTNAGISFAEQVVTVEAYRPESSFSDAVKGLHVYGGKVVMADCLVNAPVKAVAES